MKKILFEVLCDEIPAKLQQSTIDQFLKKFKEKNLEILDNHFFYGPRRWAFYCEWKDDKSKDEEKFERGPKTNAPEIAVQKFCEKFNIALDKLEKYLSNGAEYYCYRENKKISEKEFLEQTITEILNSITFPKTMDWSGNNGIKWIRPIRNILAIHDNENKIENLEIEFAGIKSNNITFGHQILTNNKVIVIKDLSLENYISVLKKEFVIIDHNERKKIILDGCKNYNYNVNELTEKHSDLLEELISIAEYPVVMKCEIKNEYLSIPHELIEYTMIKNQRYIPFLPNFLVVIDHNNPNEKMKSGYERVLNARLDDAKFFWDLMLKRDIDSLIELLKTTQSEYNPSLSVYDFNEKICVNLDFSHEELNIISCDLGTELINEFPALRGIIASEYIKRNKEKYTKLSCYAYHSYYRENELYLRNEIENSKDDKLIKLILGKHLSKLEYYLVDKNENPTGSKDPFALGNSAKAIIDLIEISEKSVVMENERVKNFILQNYINDLKNFYKNPMEQKLIEFILLSEKDIQEENLKKIINKIAYFDKYLTICQSIEFIQGCKRIFSLHSKYKEINTQNIALEEILKVLDIENNDIEYENFISQNEKFFSNFGHKINKFLDNERIEGNQKNIIIVKSLYDLLKKNYISEELIKIAIASYN